MNDPRTAARTAAAEGLSLPREVQRFGLRERLEHLTVMLLFLLLALTGMPQRFPDFPGAATLIDVFGGIERARFFHRVAGVLFALAAISHSVNLLIQLGRGHIRPSLVPHLQDFRDAIQTLRYYLGFTPTPARFDTFDYRQKFEYWGLVLGGIVMIGTGFILLFPIQVSLYLPGALIPVAKVAHGSEGLMAFLVVIVWHVYNAHLAPEVFPFEKSIFTGKIAIERLEHEHPLEYERLFGSGEGGEPSA